VLKKSLPESALLEMDGNATNQELADLLRLLITLAGKTHCYARRPEYCPAQWIHVTDHTPRLVEFLDELFKPT
jgi:hypothetical protein